MTDLSPILRMAGVPVAHELDIELAANGAQERAERELNRLVTGRAAQELAAPLQRDRTQAPRARAFFRDERGIAPSRIALPRFGSRPLWRHGAAGLLRGALLPRRRLIDLGSPAFASGWRIEKPKRP